jgi:phosphatidylglycerol:prolipoprotein diacylglycerol transferase
LLGLAYLVLAFRRTPLEAPGPAPDRRPTGIVRPLVFIALCLYPLGIPTSWTRVNIEEKRLEQHLPD